MQRRIEPGDVQTRVMALHPRLGEGVGRVERPYVPHQCPGRIGVEIGQVVGEGASVQRITERSDRLPQFGELLSGGVGFALPAALYGRADGRHDRVVGNGVGHDSSKWTGATGIATVVRSPSSADRMTTGCFGPAMSIITSGPMEAPIAG